MNYSLISEIPENPETVIV